MASSSAFPNVRSIGSPSLNGHPASWASSSVSKIMSQVSVNVELSGTALIEATAASSRTPSVFITVFTTSVNPALWVMKKPANASIRSYGSMTPSFGEPATFPSNPFSPVISGMSPLYGSSRETIHELGLSTIFIVEG
jgi:hypothetical protein